MIEIALGVMPPTEPNVSVQTQTEENPNIVLAIARPLRQEGP
jgi:hypothetical protein